MNVEKEALAILQNAETDLRRLVAQAATAGDYSGTVLVAGWAKAVTDLIRTSNQGAVNSIPGLAQEKIRKTEKATRRLSKRTKERSKYPRFLQDRGNLIRVAWSNRQKKEYQHKAPRTVLDALVVVLQRDGKDGRIFTTDTILPICNTDETEIPNYQSYVCISWLKQVGLIDQHGRQGYSIPRVADLQKDVESLWVALPKLKNGGEE